MNSILEKIDRHARRIEEIMGEYGRPMDTAIYLGRVQFEEFKAAAKVLCTIHVEEAPADSHRIEYNGRRVFLVDAENHLAIGF